MANLEHLKILKKGVEEWNKWREENPDEEVDLKGANLIGADLSDANLSDANLREANLIDTSLIDASLSGTDLSGANLNGANLSFANLIEANFIEANLGESILYGAEFSTIRGADLTGADLSGADLRGADLSGANLRGTNLSGADLSGSDLSRSSFVDTNIQESVFNGCKIYGISVWDIKGEAKEQKNLIITPPNQPEVTIDNIKVAQFIYLLLENKEIRDVLDTLTSKAVLILGRFTEKRKKVLDALKDMLRAKGYLPILFDFKGPDNRDFTETIRTLASLSKFIIADLTAPKSIPQELTGIIPNFPSIPVKPIILASQKEYGMFEHWKNFPWVCEIYKYPSLPVLKQNLDKEVIGKAEEKLKALKPR